MEGTFFLTGLGAHTSLWIKMGSFLSGLVSPQVVQLVGRTHKEWQ